MSRSRVFTKALARVMDEESELPKEPEARHLLDGEARRRWSKMHNRVTDHWPRRCRRCDLYFRPEKYGQKSCTECRRFARRQHH